MTVCQMHLTASIDGRQRIHGLQQVIPGNLSREEDEGDPREEATKAKEKKPSALDAAAKILAETGEPMNCQEMIQAMAEKGYWYSPGGQTPHAMLYSAILRALKAKGKEARFRKTERGKFATAGAA